MLAKRIIPCLDVARARVVKGTNFKLLRDAGDPVYVAESYADQGADEIFFLDIDASHEGRKTMVDVVESVAKNVFVPLSVGGGISCIDDIERLLRAGADKVSINTAAIENPELIKEASMAFGSQCIVIAIDTKKDGVSNAYYVYTHGARRKTNIEAVSWGKYVQDLGAGEILLTSIDRDGTKHGYDLLITRLFEEKLDIPIIASGGVGNLEHIYDAFVLANADAALAASIFHFGIYTIMDVKSFLKERGVCVRI